MIFGGVFLRFDDRFLQKRGAWWHYVRRVPVEVARLDGRGYVRIRLKTRMIEIARMRRDDMEQADDLFWASLVRGEGSGRDDTEARYKAAQARAVALGFSYRTVDELVDGGDLAEVVRRVGALEKSNGNSDHEFASLLGGADRPQVLVSDVLETYMEVIAPLELAGKSAKQVRSWKKIPARAVNNFIAVVGDKPIDEISRADANRYFDWWQGRVLGTGEGVQVSGNTANRDIGNMRKIYRLHFKRLGDEARDNPFRNMVIPERKSDKKKIPAFEAEFIERKMLVADAWGGLNVQAFLIVMAMIETGCRPSEICNLVASRIRLDAEVPYIKIDYDSARAIKNEASVREIPLVGVSLAAMAQAPDGFARYRDREDLLSAVLMKHFRRKSLLPSENHRIYSLRHSFEKRMLEAGIDYGLRCTLMGHSNDRPEYGDGGSLAFRRDKLEQIAFAVPPGLV